MISDQQTFKILERLLDKTRARLVNWIASNPESSEPASFSVWFPESTLSISLHEAVAEPDYFEVIITNDDEYVVKRMIVEENSAAWPVVRELYDIVGREMLGWDRVLTDIENALKGDGLIGEKSLD